MEFPEDKGDLLPTEVQESESAQMNQLLALLTKVGPSDQDIITVRQLLDTECVGKLFPMTTPWILITVKVPTKRGYHLRLGKLAAHLGLPQAPPSPDLLYSLSEWLACASARTQPGMEPADWNARLTELAVQLDPEERASWKNSSSRSIICQ